MYGYTNHVHLNRYALQGKEARYPLNRRGSQRKKSEYCGRWNEIRKLFYQLNKASVRNSMRAKYKKVRARTRSEVYALRSHTRSDFWWSRGESNPCPNIFRKSFLHVYFDIGFRELSGAKQTR